MRRSIALPLLAALFAVALPAGPAAACSVPGPTLVLGRETVGVGESFRVSGETHGGPDWGCEGPAPVLPTLVPSEEPSGTPSEDPSGTPSETPSETVSETPSEPPGETVSETPSETAIALVNVALARPAPVEPVLLHLVAGTYESTGGNREGGRLVGRADDVTTSSPYPGQQITRYTFATTATIPADLPTGPYVLVARSAAHYYGVREIRVVPALPDTGTPSGELVRLGTLLLLTGALAYALGVRPRRPLGAHARR